MNAHPPMIPGRSGLAAVAICIAALPALAGCDRANPSGIPASPSPAASAVTPTVSAAATPSPSPSPSAATPAPEPANADGLVVLSIDADGTARMWLADETNVFEALAVPVTKLTWLSGSPTGTILATSATDGLWAMDARAAVAAWRRVPGNTSLRNGAISPDGRWIGGVTGELDQPDGATVVLFELDGTAKPLSIPAPGLMNGAPAWTGPSEFVLEVIDARNRSELLVIDPIRGLTGRHEAYSSPSGVSGSAGGGIVVATDLTGTDVLIWSGATWANGLEPDARVRSGEGRTVFQTMVDGSGLRVAASVADADGTIAFIDILDGSATWTVSARLAVPQSGDRVFIAWSR